ncbi:leucine-rich repeat-containing protein 71-like [Battus philenor]|uniref:leucine-rich repeat-containing protein 71-like n=1 Tax=Battus philenor TaxID=42288 RepID=UPI0035CF94F7
MDKTEKTSVNEESIGTNNRPTPDDFVAYLPWACNQLELEHIVNVIKTYQVEYIESGVSDHSKSRNRSKSKAMRKSSRADAMSDRTEDMRTGTTQPPSLAEDAININAVHDTNEDLVEIAFTKNKFIPRQVLKVIGLIIQFYPQLTSIVIDRGADLSTIYELEKLLPISNITEVCFDGTSLIDANYEIILNQEIVRHLSLARCKLDDNGVQNIANKLTYPNPASRSLYLLNLTSNRITDVGAKYLADVLRSNRCLTYLNLSDNDITDDGAIHILNSLQEFCITPEEILLSKTRYISFLKRRNELIADKMKELKEVDIDKASKRKTGRSVATSVRKLKRGNERESMHSFADTLASNVYTSDSNLEDKATTIVLNTLGIFNDPFAKNNTVVKNEALYCLGNNTLTCLNLAFNHLSYNCLKKLVNVLLYQKQADRKPRGLIYMCIDGNNMPVSCDEFRIIDAIFESGFQRNVPTNKKKTQAKSISSR